MRRCRRDTIQGRHRRDEAVAAPRQRFNEAGRAGGVLERFPQLSDRAIQPNIEVDERVCFPQGPPELVARHDVAGTRQQHHQDLKRLMRKTDLLAVAAQIAGLCVELEDAELEDSRRRVLEIHRGGAESSSFRRRKAQVRSGFTASYSAMRRADGSQVAASDKHPHLAYLSVGRARTSGR